MSVEKGSLLAEIVATRGNEDASHARLTAAQARADEVEPWLRAFTHRPDVYSVRAQVSKPLAGVPVGVKDLIDTHDMPTAYGSPIYQRHRPREDARIAAMIRDNGGVVFGKTATTEFAWRQPAPTVNPWNRLHTPGGSSSGSAAAVAAGIVPIAVGTQTVGSVIRPAAYCGVVGYKPSYRKVPGEGVHPLATSLDHVGFFARAVEDVAIAHALFIDANPAAIGSMEAWRAYFGAYRPGRLGVVRTPFWNDVQPQQKDNFNESLEHLRAAGATVVELEFGADMQQMRDAVQTILQVEAFRSLGPVVAQHPGLVSDHLHVLVSAGAATSSDEYHEALALQARLRASSGALLAGCDALLTLPAPGEAPAGLSDTGDARFCAPWSLTGSPAVTVPSGWSTNGLPLGFQLVGEFGADLRTLQIAAWLADALPTQQRTVSIEALI